MQPKRTKYDTNPLDEKVADRAEESWGSSRPGPPTEEVRGGPTSDIGRTANEAARANPESESPTRLIDESFGASYPSVFVPPAKPRPAATYEPPRSPAASIYQLPPVPPASVYQPPPLPVIHSAQSKKVAGLGIPEKWAVILPYMPLYLALVAALVELIMVPRTETRVRFHAAQGLVLQIAITAVSTLLAFGGMVTGRWTGSGLFRIATTVFLIMSMVRVWKGAAPHYHRRRAQEMAGREDQPAKMSSRSRLEDERNR